MLSTMRRPPSGSVLGLCAAALQRAPARRRRARAWQRAAGLAACAGPAACAGLAACGGPGGVRGPGSVRRAWQRAAGWRRARAGRVHGLRARAWRRARAAPADRKWCVRNALLRVLFRKPGSGIGSSAILQRFRTGQVMAGSQDAEPERGANGARWLPAGACARSRFAAAAVTFCDRAAGRTGRRRRLSWSVSRAGRPPAYSSVGSRQRQACAAPLTRMPAVHNFLSASSQETP